MIKEFIENCPTNCYVTYHGWPVVSVNEGNTLKVVGMCNPIVFMEGDDIKYAADGDALCAEAADIAMSLWEEFYEYGDVCKWHGIEILSITLANSLTLELVDGKTITYDLTVLKDVLAFMYEVI